MSDRVRLQLALDFVDMSRAMQLASLAVPEGIDIVEAGTPLIKSEGLDAVRQLRKAFPDKTILADMKTADAGRMEMECAAKAGAHMAICLGSCTEPTIRESIEAGHNYGIDVGVDVLGVEDYVGLARKCEQWGAAFINVHLPIDEQMQGRISFEKLREIAQAVSIPVAAAGGIHSENVAAAVEMGARIVIVGGAITKAADPAEATRRIRQAIDTRAKVPTELFRRAGEEGLREVLLRVSSANLSDGAHRLPCLDGIRCRTPGVKLCGPALTVRTAPGDWSKPVLAIDQASEGHVIVIDAGGRPPAVWGELASQSAVMRKLSGVVIDGAIRDWDDIRKLPLAAFSRDVCSHAGEPKGLGEIGQPVRVGGQRVETGDWVLGDDDGVVVLPKARAVEMANRAQDVLERENRIRREIVDGRSSLGKVLELLKWEKQG
ncbi:MAG TPA: orotidine 5'-phosphate decarboxylase [Phycisphaerae bacterium]|nr:bifunctional hexulose-6-phosphate synthase/ribonuclease regulator [Phycisphaerae bacterium]HOI55686.1 orotidine 5'-phosphate decarboxylase [Phycisphaerae bacterium]